MRGENEMSGQMTTATWGRSDGARRVGEAGGGVRALFVEVGVLPHPSPLPLGEGATASVFGKIVERSKIRPLSSGGAAAKILPRPAGEGRGGHGDRTWLTLEGQDMVDSFHFDLEL